MKSNHWAKIVIHDFSKMKPKQRLAIVKWMKERAEELRCEPDLFSDRYTARYMKE